MSIAARGEVIPLFPGCPVLTWWFPSLGDMCEELNPLFFSPHEKVQNADYPDRI